jgi:hypothetical protein
LRRLPLEFAFIDSSEILLEEGDAHYAKSRGNSGKDLFLLLFVGVALWLLIFQSGLVN